MDNLDSLEDMLAALEMGEEQDAGGSYSNRDDPDDLEGLLHDMTYETKAELHTAPKRQSYSVAPQASRAASQHHSTGGDAYYDQGSFDYEDLLATERAQTDYDEYEEQAVPAESPHQEWIDTSHEPVYKTYQEASAAFQAKGFRPHHNKGKFFSMQNGDASDFRIKGTTSTKVGLLHVITLRSLNDYGEPTEIRKPEDFIGCQVTHLETSQDLTVFYKDNGDATYDLGFFSDRPGTAKMVIKLLGNPMFDLDIMVEDPGRSLWVAQPRLPAYPGEVFTIDIVTADGSRPAGVCPFEVQSMGDVDELKVFNNGDGTYKFTCVPNSSGYITIQITLHGEPIKSSPVTVQVGTPKTSNFQQVSSGYETRNLPSKHSQRKEDIQLPAPLQAQMPSNENRPSYSSPDPAYRQQSNDDLEDFEELIEEGYEDTYNEYDDTYEVRESGMVGNDDLNALLDELVG